MVQRPGGGIDGIAIPCGDAVAKSGVWNLFPRDTHVAIAGAGSIGCYVGGCLALAGRKVTLLTRRRIADAIRARGLKILDLDGQERLLPSESVAVMDEPAIAFAGARVVLVTVKSGATEEMAHLIAAHAPPEAIIVSLQNGVRNAGTLRSTLGKERTVLAGMVPFNVVQSVDESEPAFRRTTSGRCLIQAGSPGLVDFLDVQGAPFGESDDMEAVLWGKLLLNLNNALNALSGMPLAEQIADRRWRLILADQMEEALAVMRSAGVKPARAGGPSPALLAPVLRLPDLLFKWLARRMLSVDPAARSSMWEDFNRRRKTEIDEFQGMIVRLAEATGGDAPLSRRIAALVREAEKENRGSPGLSPEMVRRS